LKLFYLKRLSAALLVLCGAFLAGDGAASESRLFAPPLSQETFPAPPSDSTLVYFADESKALVALPFEEATTPLALDKTATSNKRSYLELKGETAATVIKTDEPRFYLFVTGGAISHPPFIVSLTQRRGARRVTAIAQKGYKGFAIDSELIIKPHYRVLNALANTLYMEIRPREMLLPGEYAIIGTDLRRIATFRIAPGS
jgi:hypothetical protein